MSKVFDPIRARSSVDALEMLCRSHPECAVNVTALREELAAADDQIEQLARALREAVEPPTLMGEPVSPRGVLGKLISALEFVIRHSDSLTPSDIQRMQAILAEVGGKQ